MSSAIDVRGLRKSYGEKLVLDGIDLNVAEGTIFSLLGPNGAGKTTAVQILSTLIMMADLHHLGRREARRRADELLEQFDLVGAGNTMAATYSGGMKRRLDL